MAKLSPTEKNVLKFLGGVLHLPNMPDVPFISVELGRSGITVEYPPKNSATTKKFHKKFAEFMKQYFNSIYELSSGGVRTNGNVYVLLSPSKSGSVERKSGVIPTKIQEKGTTIVFNQVLDKNKIFEQEQDILGDADTKKKLLACFGKQWEGRLEDWTWSYFQQQKEFFDEYKDNKWSPFVYDNQNFVDFFKNLVKKVKTGNNEPLKPLGTYETWNPSDIWAVKKGRMGAIKKEIAAAIPDPSHLLELNNILVKYMEDHELVGISLKKVNHPREAEIHLHNVEGSAKLKKIVGVFSKIERYDMSDIKFEPDNILKLSSVTTYIRLGPNSKFSISITRSGNNTSFTAQIKRTPDAQGGQTPINQVLKLLKGNEFSKSEKDYPQTAEDFLSKPNQKTYKTYFDLVSKHAKDKSKILKWDDWKEELNLLYSRDVRDAKVSLMQLSFWYSALHHHLKDPEFWTDMLYYGMKITSKGEFAPHAKIS